MSEEAIKIKLFVEDARTVSIDEAAKTLGLRFNRAYASASAGGFCIRDGNFDCHGLLSRMQQVLISSGC